jgi:hypothetical protein
MVINFLKADRTWKIAQGITRAPIPLENPTTCQTTQYNESLEEFKTVATKACSMR